MSIPVSTLTGANTINQMMYNVNTIKNLAANSASAITGPGSSTDNAVVRWDGTNGLSTQNSGVTIADDSSMIISGSSSGDMLRITQTGAGNALVVEDSTNPDSTPFVVTASGNVGIGTSSPDGTLHVHTDSSGTITANGIADDLVVEGGGNSGISILTPNTSIGSLFFGDPDNNNVGRIQYNHASNFMAFNVSASEAMRIDSSGNVGIGDTSPGSHYGVANRLLVREDKDGDTILGITNATSGASARLSLKMIGGTGSGYGLYSYIDNSGSPYFRFDYGSAITDLRFLFGGSEKMRLDSSGNVGIGRTPTTNKLEVAGTIESTTGGFKFPDGSTQTSAASAGITTGKAIAMAIVFG